METVAEDTVIAMKEEDNGSSATEEKDTAVMAKEDDEGGSMAEDGSGRGWLQNGGCIDSGRWQQHQSAALIVIAQHGSIDGGSAAALGDGNSVGAMMAEEGGGAVAMIAVWQQC